MEVPARIIGRLHLGMRLLHHPTDFHGHPDCVTILPSVTFNRPQVSFLYSRIPLSNPLCPAFSTTYRSPCRRLAVGLADGTRTLVPLPVRSAGAFFHNSFCLGCKSPLGYETRSTMVTSNRLLEDRGKPIGDVSRDTAILDRFLRHGLRTLYSRSGAMPIMTMTPSVP